MNLMLLLLAASTVPDWMAGCWIGKAGPVVYEEQWTKPASGSMMGIARTSKAGRVIFSEFMRIDTRDGRVIYTPRIGTRQQPVDFALKSISDSQVVFENPSHDFPQRIIYKRVADGLHARIEGLNKGKTQAEDFPMQSVSCK